MRLPIISRIDWKDPAQRLRFALLSGAAVIFLLFSLAAIFPLASHPTFCGKACHSQSPQWQSWKASAHSQVTCYACHMDVGSIRHLLKLKLYDAPVGMIATALGTEPKPINEHSHVSQALTPRERCERCHTNENRKFTFSKGIKMNHLAHKEAGLDCTVCHNRIAHKGAEDFEPLKSEWKEAEGFHYEDFLTMKHGCLRCHSGNAESRSEETLSLIGNGKKPPTACTACHTEDFDLPVGHDDPVWRTAHGKEAKKDFSVCMECHGASKEFDHDGKPWCTLCHDAAQVATFRV